MLWNIIWGLSLLLIGVFTVVPSLTNVSGNTAQPKKSQVVEALKIMLSMGLILYSTSHLLVIILHLK